MLIPFEHHVFEEMGEAAAVLRIIFRADVIPNLDGHCRRGVLFHAVDLESVRKRRMLEFERRNGQRRRGRRALLTKKRGRKDEAENDEGGGEFHESGYRSEVRHSRERKGARDAIADCRFMSELRRLSGRRSAASLPGKKWA